MVPLTVMTLNFQYFAQYPKQESEGLRRIQEITSQTEDGPPPDIICVQEGLATRNVLRDAGYDLLVSSSCTAQSVREMVYEDEQALQMIDADSSKALLTNEMFMRRAGISWEVIDKGVMRISSEVELEGGNKEETRRISGKLAVRTLTWVKLKPAAAGAESCVYVLNTHITGGRFEDQFFVQQLAQERFTQTEFVIKFFQSVAQNDDIGILVGDFNATKKYTQNGPMHGYYMSSIANSPGVQMDAQKLNIDIGSQLEERFKEYMTSPFNAIERCGWTLAYSEEDVGTTSAFGHLVDHMAVSRPDLPVRTEKFLTTNQRFSKQRDTDVPITDHNAVKATFYVTCGASVSKRLRELLGRYCAPGTRLLQLELIQNLLVRLECFSQEELQQFWAVMRLRVLKTPEAESVDYEVFLDWLFDNGQSTMNGVERQT